MLNFTTKLASAFKGIDYMGGGFRGRNYSVEGTPILSIITPVFNGERFIAECIESVVGQNCIGVEHIVVDGRSTDRTVEIVRERAHVHSHLRWISEPDRGQSDALNKGIAMA